jgi:CDGSH-type Zn-finger protein
MNEALVQNGPVAVELRAGTIDAWCACGWSVTRPFCDGTHEQTSLTPVVFRAKPGGPAYLCGCTTSQGRAHCDGSHNRP